MPGKFQNRHFRQNKIRAKNKDRTKKLGGRSCRAKDARAVRKVDVAELLSLGRINQVRW